MLESDAGNVEGHGSHLWRKGVVTEPVFGVWHLSSPTEQSQSRENTVAEARAEAERHTAIANTRPQRPHDCYGRGAQDVYFYFHTASEL